MRGRNPTGGGVAFGLPAPLPPDGTVVALGDGLAECRFERGVSAEGEDSAESGLFEPGVLGMGGA